MVILALGFFGLGMLCDRRALAAVFKLFTRVSVDTSVWSDPALEGPLGRIIDILSVIATILGVSVILGHAVSQFVSEVYNITGMGWLMNIDGSPSKIAMIVSLVIVMVASTLSALSGVGNGIKWLSNVNMGLSFSCWPFSGL